MPTGLQTLRTTLQEVEALDDLVLSARKTIIRHRDLCDPADLLEALNDLHAAIFEIERATNSAYAAARAILETDGT